MPGGIELILIVVVVVLLFGRGKISGLMGDVAKGITSFRKGMKEAEEKTDDPLEPKVIDNAAQPVADPVKDTEKSDS